ncbi:hypothetical protein BS50DRAFT_659461 [Corynespora cassiicola Philippines]|uniref:Uncharacterized protein n=1 Tax=Corynespora cassiicola Philippines TaxID=1448308 RepID=A0A2T2NZ69_CORCC|nr:hypothetical protein BS50DRAFT_659461 [Corynespora cassiicola Philippines]
MALFCCNSITPYRPQRLNHEEKFTNFMNWAKYPQESSLDSAKTPNIAESNPPHAVQLVRQINFGALESKRYFAPDENGGYDEISEDSLIQANFKKLNSYKNYKCDEHNKFFEVNIYQKDPVNKHHWRMNLARPASSIDL